MKNLKKMIECLENELYGASTCERNWEFYLHVRDRILPFLEHPPFKGWHEDCKIALSERAKFMQSLRTEVDHVLIEINLTQGIQNLPIAKNIFERGFAESYLEKVSKWLFDNYSVEQLVQTNIYDKLLPPLHQFIQIHSQITQIGRYPWISIATVQAASFITTYGEEPLGNTRISLEPPYYRTKITQAIKNLIYEAKRTIYMQPDRPKKPKNSTKQAELSYINNLIRNSGWDPTEESRLQYVTRLKKAHNLHQSAKHLNRMADELGIDNRTPQEKKKRFTK